MSNWTPQTHQHPQLSTTTTPTRFGSDTSTRPTPLIMGITKTLWPHKTTPRTLTRTLSLRSMASRSRPLCGLLPLPILLDNNRPASQLHHPHSLNDEQHLHCTRHYIPTPRPARPALSSVPQGKPNCHTKRLPTCRMVMWHNSYTHNPPSHLRIDSA